MRVLCAQCKNIYKLPGSALLPNKLFIAIILFAIATSLLRGQIGYSFNLILTIIAIIFLMGAAIIVFNLYKNQWNCIKCNGKKTLLKLDTPEAIKIIRGNNLTIPEDDPEDNKLPWQA